ncbi:hypothetical protein N7517_010068 [Penicillium concentricum]|uniref:Uncharacterized protein n=1 Tax=Penicillium concentricum TaxID=293559 RepID=A0A9W9RIF0_9EURO|nr:uncharacterized protein N7517_010068 [Penicillium concentricum]KAJ5360877.1 hypothetical protein N7517_010068 [Penicillium concentricum]
MRLRSNHVLPPITEYVPRRRRQTRSASAQAGTEAATEAATVTALEVAQETVPETQSAEERPAPKRKPAKRAGRKKKAAPKGKKPAATADCEVAESPETQENALALIPSVEQPDTRTLPPKPTRAPARKRIVRGRDISAALRYGSAGDLLKKEYWNPTPSPPQTPVTQYAWPPGIVYNKLKRIPWSLPWSPPSPPRAWPHRRSLHMTDTQDEPELTRTEEPFSRKRNRLSEDDPSASKRHKLTLHPPSGFENRPRGSPRRTYADRARRREAERDGRIDRTIYRFPQLLAQQGEDVRSGNSNPPTSHTSEETTPRGNGVVPFSSLPSALPPNHNQPENRPGWRQWIFSSVTGLWRRDNAPQTPEVPQVAEPQHLGNESSSSIATPLSAPPSSALVPQRNFESPTPRPRIAESRTSHSRLTASARAPQVGKRKKYSYDLDPPGFDPELLARMRARKSNPEDLQPVTSPEQVRARYENESKKRKRSASPDVIPHPPGCSYGFDPDYFIYDDEDEDLPTGEQGSQDTKAKQATVSDVPEEEHVSKRVRSDNTLLENEPEEHISKRVRSDNTHLENAPEQHISKRVRSDNTLLENEPEEHISKRVRSDNTHLENFKHPVAQQTEYSAQELRKAREQAEQYKPKTPSRLRAAHRFSTSCTELIEEDEADRRRKMRKTSLAKACPTGDLNHIIWPETEPWVDRFDWGLPDLDKWMTMGPKHWTDELVEDYHQLFMAKLAEKRAQN